MKGPAFVLVLGLALLAAQLVAAPTVYHCYVTEGGWKHLTGKTHCEMEGWRAVWRLVAHLK